jgi:hypothetical protein
MPLAPLARWREAGTVNHRGRAVVTSALSPFWRLPFWCLRVLLWVAFPPAGWALSRWYRRRRYGREARARAIVVIG